MSDGSATESAPKNSTKKRHPTRPWWKSSRSAILAALGVALIAVVLALVALFHPLHRTPHFNDQQTAEAKTNVCAAYTTVRQGVVISTHMASPDPNNPIGQLAVAVNARLALLGGGAYLRDRVAAQPAAPGDLKKALESMANTTEQLGVNYLAEASGDVQDPLRSDLDSEITQINKLCG